MRLATGNQKAEPICGQTSLAAGVKVGWRCPQRAGQRLSKQLLRLVINRCGLRTPSPDHRGMTQGIDSFKSFGTAQHWRQP